jgi:hypothetical protein
LSSDLVVTFDDFFPLCFCCSLMGKSGKPFDNYPPHGRNSNRQVFNN